MIKLKLQCKGCGYTWYPEKKRWERDPKALEPDCPNNECPYYGTGYHSPNNSIWLIKGLIDTSKIATVARKRR